mmetsp:Transcript_26646/g.38069  ORF Transcript_26646/g.38069 Transcript_26646/m.38069 type:complete len:497 (-) Transcript_26646:181-1671(-)
MTTASYEAHELEQILSLLNDQHECLTLRSIMLELAVTRSVARDILEEVVNRAKKAAGGSAAKYEVVRMIPKRGEGGKRTAMELVVTDPADSDDERHNQGSIFSISICNDTQDVSEDMDEDDVDENGNVISNQVTTGDSVGAAGAIQVVAAAHEKALAVQRDMFTTGSNGGVAQLCSIFGADGVKANDGSSSRSILPAPELCVEDEEGIRVIRREKRGRDVVVVGASYPSSAAGKKSKFGSNSSSAASKPSHTAPTKTKKGKATTAAAFFKNANATSSKTKKAEPKKSKKEEEKENSRNKKSKTTNVDDFVGDVDEDEEFLEEEKARKARVAKEARKEARELMNDEKAKKRNTEGIESKRSKVAPKRQKRDEESGENYMDIDYDDGDAGDEEKKTGAMDAFTQKKEKSAPSAGSTSSGGVKKRRKKLVEETTVDANGYMRTETITVWEDVSDDEVEVKAKTAVTKAVAPKPKGKNSLKKSGGAKKQAGLASFFAKKK